MSTATVTEITDFDVTESQTARPLVVQQARAVTTTSATPADLVRYAMDSGADIDRLERLMKMQIEWEKHEAKKAYDAAMAEFKLNPPSIFKDKHVEFKTSNGITAYDHATIGNVVEKVIAALAVHGFSHCWIPRRTEGGMMSITCEVTHKLGHSKETTLEAGLDQSGGKNNIQAMSSTVTYLERYSLLAAVGLATKDMTDDDGRGAEDPPPASENARPATSNKASAQPALYDQTKFDANKDTWREMVKSGRKTAAAMIQFIESKGAKLTEAQQLTIDSWAHEEE